jgi:hypothetical protein
VVDDDRHAMIGVELQKFRGELIAAGYVDGNQPIGGRCLLQEDRDFFAIGRRPVIKINHLQSLRDVMGRSMSGDSARDAASAFGGGFHRRNEAVQFHGVVKGRGGARALPQIGRHPGVDARHVSGDYIVGPA